MLDALAATLTLVAEVLTRDENVARRLASDPPLWGAFGVAVLAWLSTGIAHTGILYLNRVRGVRALIAGALGLVWVTVLRVVEATVTWGVASLVTRHVLPVETVVTVFLLALAPQVFNALTFVPHIGLAMGRLLQLWSVLVLFLLLAAAYAMPAWQALLVVASGWLVVQVLSRLVAAPLGWLASRAWSLVSDQPVLVTSRDILAGTPFVPVGAQRQPREVEAS
ncbi:MAG TPA: hypothetical protein GXZ45_09915 [Propionibacterium sp.]|nr:hypothetical protein [Propionibacterium sp.]